MTAVSRPGSFRLVVLLLSAGLFCGAAPGMFAAEDVPPSGTAAREYTVFLGLELTIDDVRASPVVWADRENIEIVREGEVVRLPRRTTALKSTLVPRLGRTLLTLEKLQGRRRYSYANDPDRAALAEHLALQSAQDDARQGAELRRFQAEAQVRQLAGQARGQPVPANALREANARMQEASQALESTYALPQFNPELTDSAPGRTVDTGSGGTFDAFEATFSVSAARELRDVNAVLRLFIRDPSNPELIAPVHRFFRVKSIGPEPRRLSLLQDRLPPGFTVESFSVHFFQGTEELPTTEARNRLDVSAEEAHQFLILQHLQEKRNARVPIAIIPELLPPELSTLITSEQRDVVVEFSVDAAGRVVDVTAPPGAAPFSPELGQALRRVPFLPATTEGRAVAGRGHFALSEFVR